MMQSVDGELLTQGKQEPVHTISNAVHQDEVYTASTRKMQQVEFMVGSFFVISLFN